MPELMLSRHTRLAPLVGVALLVSISDLLISMLVRCRELGASVSIDRTVTQCTPAAIRSLRERAQKECLAPYFLIT